MRVAGFTSPQSGSDIMLTLDVRLQQIAEECSGDRKGSVVIMDPYSGEILVMASSPGYDPNSFSNRKGGSLSGLFSHPDAVLFNRSISGLYPPGSVFKLIVAAAALEKATVNESASFICTGGIHIGNKIVKCWDSHGEQSMNAAIAHSCDVYFYHTALALRPQAIRGLLRHMAPSGPADSIPRASRRHSATAPRIFSAGRWEAAASQPMGAIGPSACAWYRD